MSFEEWYDLHKDDISEKVELRLSLIDLFASAYEAGMKADVHTDNSAVITELEKENAELKKKNKWYSEQVCNKECAEVWGNLDKAKEIMNIAIEGIKYWGIVGGNERPFEKQAEMLFNLFLDKAEQFFKDSEVEK